MPDANALRQVDPLGQGAITPDLILRWVETTDHTFMLLPEPSGLPVAYGELAFPRHLGGVYAQHVIVDPRARGRGYGWTLLERLGLVTHARFNYDEMHIQVARENTVAVALLKAMGFAEVAPIVLIHPEGSGQVPAYDLAARLPLPAFQPREHQIPTPGEEPGYGRGLRSAPPR